MKSMRTYFALAVIATLGMPIAAQANDVAVVLNSGENSISLVDRLRHEEIERVTVGREPHHLMATPDDQYLIVAESASNDLLFLDPKTGAIKLRLDNISDPYQIGFSPNKKYFVATSLRLDRVDSILKRRKCRVILLSIAIAGSYLSLCKVPTKLPPLI
jgi:DNA-binding beta-propeller fold protein YncE